MNYAVSLLKEIITKRKLIWDLGKADFRKRFVGSYFGIVWMFIQPIVTVVIYAVIFGIGLVSAACSWSQLCGMAGSGHCTLVLFQRGVKHRNGLSSGIQLSGQKGGFQSRDPADHQADFLSAGPCLFRADHGGNVPDRRDAGARYWIQVLYYTFAASVLVLGLGYLQLLSMYFLRIWLRSWESACSLASGSAPLCIMNLCLQTVCPGWNRFLN